MNINIDFPFHGYNKGDLIKFCFGEHADVDTAIPIDLVRIIQKFTNDINGHHWFVMDYTENKVCGKLVNLKEKFFKGYPSFILNSFHQSAIKKLRAFRPFFGRFSMHLIFSPFTHSCIMTFTHCLRKTIHST